MFKELFKLILWSIFFTIVVFFIKTTFFTDKNILVEQKYIEPSLDNKTNLKVDRLKDILKQKEKKDLNSAQKYYFIYIPWEIKTKLKDYKNDIKIYIDNKNLFKTISELRIDLYEKKADRRWKMKNKTVKIFAPIRMWQQETLSVFIHEFSHYIDLYYFKNNWWYDISNKFYNISWDSTKIIKKWQTQSDFVSWYSMTNKYEDFAESLTYYVVANQDFLIKSESSEVLRKKYDFFSDYLFSNGFLKNTKFSTNLVIRKYYRDITKIKIDLKKFLQFFQK